MDSIIHSIYRAAAGLAPWSESLEQMAARYDVWIARVFARDPQSGTLLYNHEGGAVEAALPWQREYHRADPFAALLEKAPCGEMVECREHFDDEYIASNEFYQRFLLPKGIRYSYGAKLGEQEGRPIVFMLRHGENRPPLSDTERRVIEDEL